MRTYISYRDTSTQSFYRNPSLQLLRKKHLVFFREHTQTDAFTPTAIFSQQSLQVKALEAELLRSLQRVRDVEAAIQSVKAAAATNAAAAAQQSQETASSSVL